MDLDWRLLTESSANFGNALTNAAGQVRQHRETATTRNALTNYLANPEDQAAFQGYAARDPQGAFQIQDHHLSAARALRGEQQQQLDTLGQILTGPTGQPITAAEYPQALALAQRAGIDTTGHEAYDPAFVTGIVQLHSRLHPVDPVSVAPDARLVNPQTGVEVAHGNPAQTNLQREVAYYESINRHDLAQQLMENHAEGAPVLFDVTGDGVPDLVPRSYVRQQQGGGAPAPAPDAPPEFIHNRQTGATMRLNPQTNQYEPYNGPPPPAAAPAFSSNAPLTVEDRRNQYPSHAPGRAGRQGPRTFR